MPELCQDEEVGNSAWKYIRFEEMVLNTATFYMLILAINSKEYKQLN
jgi:hypothetical protein